MPACLRRPSAKASAPYSIASHQALAEEAAQETFIRVWKALDSFRGESSPSTWIYSIARNTCLMRKTRALTETGLDAGAIERLANRQQPPAAPGSGTDWERALADLPDKYRAGRE